MRRIGHYKDRGEWSGKDIFHPNARWANGDPINVDTSMYSWQQALDPNKALSYGIDRESAAQVTGNIAAAMIRNALGQDLQYRRESRVKKNAPYQLKLKAQFRRRNGEKRHFFRCDLRASGHESGIISESC